MLFIGPILRRRGGFTLVELSIVLLVAALAVNFSVAAMQVGITIDCYARTRQQMLTISDAIKRFEATNQRLPLPAARNLASGSAFYGREATSASDPGIDNANSTLYGALPFQALSLTSNYGADCWGNKFTYLVGSSFVATSTYAPSNGGPITVKRGTLSSNVTMISNASYAVISHGPEAAGSVKANYADASHGWCTVGTRIDSENCDLGNATLFMTDISGGTTPTNFSDDLVVYGKKTAAPGVCCSSGSAAYAWGLNTWGQVGDGTTTNRSTPTAVSGGLSFTQLSRGLAHACGIASSGAAYCWGKNDWGEIGSGSSTNPVLSPVAVTGGTTYTSLSAGSYYTCGLTLTGLNQCWGYNLNFQFGTLILLDINLSPVDTNTGPWLQAQSNGDHSCALDSGGNAYCWGDNLYGESGVANLLWLVVQTPSSVVTSLTFARVEIGPYHSCGITSAGTAYCWGRNNSGQLGAGAGLNVYSPNNPVSGGLSWAQISAGGLHTCGLTTGGAAYCWGDNSYGQIGDNTLTDRTTPRAVTTGGLTFVQIKAMDDHSCALTAAGAAYCWGHNNYGQLGDGTTTDRKLPTAVSGGLSFRYIGGNYLGTVGLLGTP